MRCKQSSTRYLWRTMKTNRPTKHLFSSNVMKIFFLWSNDLKHANNKKARKTHLEVPFPRIVTCWTPPTLWDGCFHWLHALVDTPPLWDGCFHWLHPLVDTAHPLGWVLLNWHYPAGIHLSMLKSQKEWFHRHFVSFHPSFISSIFIPLLNRKPYFAILHQAWTP